MHKFKVFYVLLLTNPFSINDLKMLQSLEAIKDASRRKEVDFRLKVIEFYNSCGKEATVEASLVFIELRSLAGRNFLKIVEEERIIKVFEKKGG
ncbi:MAG: hypothetical protein RMI93_05540 [Caldimicrobium sp.]|nr:hypothetical protein [Caldimicrobium sp.]MDW8183048.1 hypothetical protein [Caldimicrobium sp.]